MSRCLELGLVAEFGRLYFQPEMVYMARNLFYRRLGSQSIDDAAPSEAPLLGVLTQGMDSLKHSSAVVATNVIAVICGNERGTLSSSIIHLVLSRAATLHPLAGLVVLNAIGHLGIGDGQTQEVIREDARPDLERLVT